MYILYQIYIVNKYDIEYTVNEYSIKYIHKNLYVEKFLKKESH